jgi:hypothetical protein
VNGASARVELGDCDFFDLQHSAFFNSLPVTHDGLLDGGAPRDYTMRFVHVPSLEHEAMHQRYTPRGNHVVHYQSGTFEADITFDADGFVTLYEDYLEQVGVVRR